MLTMPKQNDKAKVKAKKIHKRVKNYAVEIPIQPEEEKDNNNQDKCTESEPSKYVKTPKRVECQVCDKKFKYQCELRDHMRAHTGEKPFKCNKCKHAFRRKYLLNRHIATSHETDSFDKSNMSCAVCNETFPQKEELLKHLEKHVTIDDNKFSCCVCGNKFQGKNYLIFHLRRHSDKNHICKICKRKFKHKEDYKTHLEFHDMQKNQPALYCLICTAVFTHKNIFDSHMRLHTGEKPFSCDTCDQKFTFKVALVRHVCIDGERPYMRRLEPNKCNKCNTQLPNQIKSQAGEKPSCENCKTKYAFQVPKATHTSIMNEDTIVTEQNIRGEEINNIQTVKVEKNETWIEVSGRMESETEIKREIERDEMEFGDIDIAEVKIEIQSIERKVNAEF